VAALPGETEVLGAMKFETRVFGLSNGKYENLKELARVMGISLAQIYRVRAGKRDIGEKFIIGAVKAFPGYKLDDLFYVVPDGSEMTDSRSDLGAKGNLESPEAGRDEIVRNALSMPPEARHDEIVKLRKAGQTYENIGRRFGISKERVRQILQGNPVPQKPAPDGMLIGREVAQLLNLHINTVRRWSNLGRLKTYRINSRGDRRFRQEDVDALLKVGRIIK